MAISKELLEILVCPEDKTPVQPASPAKIEELNQRISAGTLKNRAGKPVAERIDAGLVRQDGRFLYPIRDDIPVMLIDEAIPLD